MFTMQKFSGLLLSLAMTVGGCYGTFDPTPNFNDSQAVAQAAQDFPAAATGELVSCADLNNYPVVSLTIPESLIPGQKDDQGNPTQLVKVPAYDVLISGTFSVPDGDPAACVLDEQVLDGASPKLGRTVPVYYAVRSNDGSIKLRLWLLGPWAVGTAAPAK